MQHLFEMGVKSQKAWLKKEFHHICLSVCLCAIDVWSRSSFRVTSCRFPQCWCRQNNWSCTEISPFTDCNETHFFCKFWIQSLDMQPFYWFKWYKWLKMAFKMSQELPTDRILPKIFVFLLLLPVSGHLSRGFTVPPTKRAYSALHLQALTACSPQDFRRSSITNIAF